MLTFVLTSAAGADLAATFYYLRSRGELEGDIASLAFPRARFLRPGPLDLERRLTRPCS